MVYFDVVPNPNPDSNILAIQTNNGAMALDTGSAHTWYGCCRDPDTTPNCDRKCKVSLHDTCQEDANCIAMGYGSFQLDGYRMQSQSLCNNDVYPCKWHTKPRGQVFGTPDSKAHAINERPHKSSRVCTTVSWDFPWARQNPGQAPHKCRPLVSCTMGRRCHTRYVWVMMMIALFAPICCGARAAKGQFRRWIT